ncbi:MAG: hypothetical protein WBB28_07765 [Crinalium sp.]
MEKIVTKINKNEQKSDFSYWQKQPYQSRLEALEQIRQEYHHYIYNDEPRLQIIYTILKR